MAFLEDRDQLYAWVQRDFEWGGNFVSYLPTAPLFEPFRSDPQFRALVRKPAWIAGGDRCGALLQVLFADRF